VLNHEKATIVLTHSMNNFPKTPNHADKVSRVTMTTQRKEGSFILWPVSSILIRHNKSQNKT